MLWPDIQYVGELTTPTVNMFMSFSWSRLTPTLKPSLTDERRQHFLIKSIKVFMWAQKHFNIAWNCFSFTLLSFCTWTEGAKDSSQWNKEDNINLASVYFLSVSRFKRHLNMIQSYYHYQKCLMTGAEFSFYWNVSMNVWRLRFLWYIICDTQI